MQKLVYFVFKNYKGLFKKKHKENYHYLVFSFGQLVSKFQIISEATLYDEKGEEKSVYIASLIIQLPYSKKLDPTEIPEIVKRRNEKFRDSVVTLDVLDCKPKELENGFYLDVNKKGDYIKGDLRIEKFQSLGSQGEIFIIDGPINLEVEDVDPNSTKMKMLIKKKTSITSNLTKLIKNYIKR